MHVVFNFVLLTVSKTGGKYDIKKGWEGKYCFQFNRIYRPLHLKEWEVISSWPLLDVLEVRREPLPVGGQGAHECHIELSLQTLSQFYRSVKPKR